jgi:ubiquinone/menaquinone biosynthesis C-methylase UbiE
MPHGWTKDYNHAERLLWQNSDQILANICLEPGDTMVDIGCGDGFFSLPAAKLVGRTGLIYALDASDEAIAQLQAKANSFDLTNIRAVVADAEQTIICRHCADIILMANVLHDFDNPLKVLANAKEMLKPDGFVVDLDWKKEPRQQHGPPLEKRLSQDEASAILNQAGYSVKKNIPSGPFHYLLLAEPI